MDGLFDPANHRPLTADGWSDGAARTAIARIAADAVEAHRGRGALWPNDADDLEGGPDIPYRNVYFGAAGVGWALHRLAADDLGPELPGTATLMADLLEDYLAAPELGDIAPGPGPAVSLLMGESGIRLAAAATGAAVDDAGLAACVHRGLDCRTRELCWGSPGTMTAALSMWRRSGDPRWRSLWRESARWLLDEWSEPVWEQDLYGERHRFVGAGHGFAGNAAALLAGGELLAERRAEIETRVARALSQLAVERDGLAQWPSRHGEPWKLSVQWCHGAPGIVISLAALPADTRTDALLLAGGELTWTAGPLRKGPGLCHGTAGNAYAFLALLARTGDERWRARARAFAADAAADVERRRASRGRGRYSLFTGDLGVALLLRDCLRAGDGAAGPAGFPFLSDA